MTNKKRLFAIINIVLLLLLVVAAILGINRNNNQTSVTEISFTAEAGKSILEQTEQQGEVTVYNAGQGAYVESIGGLKNGDRDGGIWTYYVNGKEGDVVPSDYITKGGELIEWKFETE